jgi:hypothetical protein
MHEMYAVISTGRYDVLSGGQYVQNPPERVPFQGVVMPVSDKDLRNAPVGTYTEDSEKLYTNGFQLKVGAQVTDPYDGRTYLIEQELQHNSIHPMKRYVVKAKGEASAK